MLALAGARIARRSGHPLAWMFLLASLSCGGEPKQDAGAKAPEWVRAGRPIAAADIPDADLEYLTRWVEANAKPAGDYLIGLFARKDVVVLGEAHHVREHKELVSGLVPRLYREAGVRCIGWEFSHSKDNERLARLTTGPEFDAEAVLAFARESVQWNSKEHWDFIEAVWRLNHSLEPGQEKMRLVGLDSDWEPTRTYVALRTEAEDSAEFQAAKSRGASRDRHMAGQVEKEILDQGQKGLVFVGRAHDFTHHEFPPDVNWGRDIMGRLLFQRHGERVFQVWLGFGILSVVSEAAERAGGSPLGFDLYSSPFAKILGAERFPDARNVTLDRVARGYIHFGPRSGLHRNTSIPGFVTPEMFERYKSCAPSRTRPRWTSTSRPTAGPSRRRAFPTRSSEPWP
jgi:hypothetical protein